MRIKVGWEERALGEALPMPLYSVIRKLMPGGVLSIRLEESTSLPHLVTDSADSIHLRNFH